ncbi:MAG: class I SAM-dependent methyltransferase [Gammaproteobacteria bacterium]|nr:class I SAM-dependent methyltransferase [Gammaproteobacteria bacterium]
MNKHDNQRTGMHDATGWESVADWFIQHSATSTVGYRLIDLWAQSLPMGADVLDVGCGSGSPRSQALMRNDFRIYAVDGASTLAAAYKDRFPDAQVACENVTESRFFDSSFDGILAWGLVFLLPHDEQLSLLNRLVAALKPEGRLLFTAPSQRCTWNDATTGQQSVSLGSDAYRAHLSALGAPVLCEFDGEGENHYYSARRIQGPGQAERS